MGKFTSLNKTGSPFLFKMPETGVNFLKASQVYEEQGNIQGFDGWELVTAFINKQSKYGAHPVVGIIFKNTPVWVDLPEHTLDVIETIMSDKDLIDGVNNRECWFKITKFHSRKYNKDGYGIEFIDKD